MPYTMVCVDKQALTEVEQNIQQGEVIDLSFIINSLRQTKWLRGCNWVIVSPQAHGAPGVPPVSGGRSLPVAVSWWENFNIIEH